MLDFLDGSEAMDFSSAFPHDGSGGIRRTPHRMDGVAHVLQIMAFAYTCGVSLALPFLPTYSTVSVTGGGQEVVGTSTLLDMNPASSLVALALPLLLTIIPLLMPQRWWFGVSLACLVILGLFVFVASSTVGCFYLPAFILILVALTRRGRQPSGEGLGRWQ